MSVKICHVQDEETNFICKLSHRQNQKTNQGMEKKLNNNNIELSEYIVDPRTKTTYLKGKFLGKGGFAHVHEITDLTTNKIYAGKIVQKANLTKSHQTEKILREVEVHNLLEHKNIVRFYGCFEDEKHIYILLENCPRKSLAHVLKKRKVLTEQEVRYYIHQLVEGVEYIHNCGVIHRDLKLGNLLLSENMEVKIGDFGLASHIVKEGYRKRSVCGTPNYIAPEVLSMEGHGKEADIWAIGCIMYAMLVGHPPFETTTLNETYSRISNNSYCMPMNISESARTLIFRMLKSRPADRPDITEILQDEFFCSGFMPTTLPPSCCSSPPKFPAMGFIPRFCLDECDSFNQDLKQITHAVSTLRVHGQSKTGEEQQSAKGFHLTNKKHPKKDDFTSNFRSKLESFLCSEKNKMKDINTSESLYSILLSCLENMPKDPVVSKWRVEYYDLSNKLKVYSSSNVPSILLEKYTLLRYFSQYMEENLTEGGDIKQLEVTKKKKTIPYMKRWVRTSRAIVMQLNCGTLQMNFFMDHTKLIVSGGKHHGKLTYINEFRHTSTFSIADISQYGCKSDIVCRIQYALSVLREFAELEQDDL
ncbi:serine/threonine-protein kinase PLK2-like [Limulus polyphemus]|uniref:Serine/threonine-protein kinase PLK n=1 Tax=Limulus polyphemus TaxID=6850 RepID=A0ABM1BUC6_LIMPO|nr:serine/threonine-protein kinase PLK2-like [Limulus polyphemus]